MNADEVRHLVYSLTAESGRIPRAAEVAERLSIGREDVLGNFRELNRRRLLALAPESGEIVMAPPFSAVPTVFPVDSGALSYYASCVWDAYGIPAALHRDAVSPAACACCGEPIEMRVENGAPVPTEGVAHFAVPAAHWWDDLVYT